MNAILENKTYYEQMLKKDRAFPFLLKNKQTIGCLITFYICHKENLDKYIQGNPWEVLSDDKDGDTCYAAQLLTDNETFKELGNPRIAFEVWHKFKLHILHNYKNVKCIYWLRFNKDKNELETRIKKIREE